MGKTERMLIGTRLRQLRKQQKMSQGDIEERTGLLRSYISRVENGHTAPSLETLERFAGVLGVPLYQLFISGEEAPSSRSRRHRIVSKELTGDDGEKETDARFLRKLSKLLSRAPESDRDVFLSLAERLTTR
jgi:transcriptional regulator with XRE-family HTH domain